MSEPDETEEVRQALLRLHLAAIAQVSSPGQSSQALARPRAEGAGSGRTSQGAEAQPAEELPAVATSTEEVEGAQVVPRHEVVRAPPPVLPAEESGRNYYVIYACPAQPGLVGIHHTTWSKLQARLPGGGLAGSGARTCKRFSSRDAALSYYAQNTSELAREVVVYRY